MWLDAGNADCERSRQYSGQAENRAIRFRSFDLVVIGGATRAVDIIASGGARLSFPHRVLNPFL